MPHSSQLSFMGVAKEVTPGTPIAPTAFIPVSPPSGKDALTMLADAGLRGAMVDEYDEIAGPRSGTFEFDGDVFPDTIPWALAGILGDVTTTGASAPYTHVISTQNGGDGQTKSYTLTDYYAVAARAYPGAKFNEVDIKFTSDGMLTYSAKATTYGSKTATKPTASFTAVAPLATWIGVITVGGSAGLVVTDGEIDIKRPTTVIQAIDNSQDPAVIWGGPVSVEGKMTVVMEDDTELTKYLNNTASTLSVDFSSGASLQVKFDMSKVKYSAAEIGRGKDYVELAITFKAFANVTDVGASAGYSPIKATVKNAVASGVYA